MRCQYISPFPIGWWLRDRRGRPRHICNSQNRSLSKLLIQRLKHWWSSTSENSFPEMLACVGSLQLLYTLDISQSSQHTYGIGTWISTVGWTKKWSSEKLGQLPKIKQLVRAWCQAQAFSFLYSPLPFRLEVFTCAGQEGTNRLKLSRHCLLHIEWTFPL